MGEILTRCDFSPSIVDEGPPGRFKSPPWMELAFEVNDRAYICHNELLYKYVGFNDSRTIYLLSTYYLDLQGLCGLGNEKRCISSMAVEVHDALKGKWDEARALQRPSYACLCESVRVPDNVPKVLRKYGGVRRFGILSRRIVNYEQYTSGLEKKSECFGDFVNCREVMISSWALDTAKKSWIVSIRYLNQRHFTYCDDVKLKPIKFTLNSLQLGANSFHLLWRNSFLRDVFIEQIDRLFGNVDTDQKLCMRLESTSEKPWPNSLIRSRTNAV